MAKSLRKPNAASVPEVPTSGLKGTTKLQFEVSEKLMKEIARLKDSLELSGHRDFFAISIGVLRWCEQQAKLGETVGSLNQNDEFTPLNLPAFDIIRDNALAEMQLKYAETLDISPTAQATHK